MILKLIESRHARVLAGWALVTSIGVHATGVGEWVRESLAAARGRSTPHNEFISVRYLLPLDHVERPVGERIRWVAVGTGTSGFVQGTGPRGGASRDPGDTPPAEAKRPDPVPEGDAFDVTRLYSVDDVDSAATRDPTSEGPRYPEALREQGVQGEVLVEFTVDTTGRADTTTFTVVESSHPLFTAAVREALPGMRFTPAVAHGRRVRQLVRLPMKFKLMLPEKLTI